jgi:hypothetical protein
MKYYWVEDPDGKVVFSGTKSPSYYKRHGGCKRGYRLLYTINKRDRPSVEK